MILNQKLLSQDKISQTHLNRITKLHETLQTVDGWMDGWLAGWKLLFLKSSFELHFDRQSRRDSNTKYVGMNFFDPAPSSISMNNIQVNIAEVGNFNKHGVSCGGQRVLEISMKSFETLRYYVLTVLTTAKRMKGYSQTPM